MKQIVNAEDTTSESQINTSNRFLYKQIQGSQVHQGSFPAPTRCGAPALRGDRNDQSAICQAALLGDLPAVRGLIRAHPGAVHHTDGEGPVPQSLAAAPSQPRAAAHAGNTVLHSAACNGHLELVELLLTANVPLDVQNSSSRGPRSGWTAVDLQIQKRNNCK